MPIVRCVAGALFVTGLAMVASGADGPSRFAVPRSKEAWASQETNLRDHLVASLPGHERQNGTADDVRIATELLSEVDGLRIERFRFADEKRRMVRGLYVRRTGLAPGERLPAVFYLTERKDDGSDFGLDGLGVAADIARRGFAAIALMAPARSSIFAEPGGWRDIIRGAFKPPASWPEILSDDLVHYTRMVKQPEIDPKRVGVLGLGHGGSRAVWLMALAKDISRGMAIGGLARFEDWTARHPGKPVPAWMVDLQKGKDLEAVVALCAGRPLEWTIGDRDPSCPMSSVALVDSVGKQMDRLVDGKGVFHVTYLGRQDQHYGLLQMMGAMEFFENAFFPRTATPLGHAPEPEPAVTGEFVDLAANGLAGWVVEMSQRPGTWTWKDGVIACKPGPNEYGWLRAPIEVGDFILTVEWKVPANGNSGIFLRARPVPWTFPPSPLNKRIVSALGLDWPSRTGLELQAADDHGHADKYSSGSLYRHAAPAANPTNPAGQWNKYTVRARGTRVEVWTNGQQVLGTTIDKYPLTLADPPLRGYIGLQNHGAPAEFRNVRLLRLNP